MKIAILQRVIPEYRLALFRRLSINADIEFKIFIGDDVPKSKVKSSKNLSNINVVKNKTIFIDLRSRVLVWHRDLISNLKIFQPDVILCEGESHFIGYVQAIIYKIFVNRKVKLIHWCFISLPGESLRKNNFRFYLKGAFRNFFSGFLVYSSFSKKCLLELGQPSEKIFVSTNVGDVATHMKKYDSIEESKKEIRNKLNLRCNGCTVLYLGTLDANKRPEIISEIANLAKADSINFLVLGEGPQFKKMEETILEKKLENIHLMGRIKDELSLYCKASDILIVPGRGGIVISEAMSYEMAVIVHQCDGTESDLVIPEESGYILERGDALEFYDKIKYLSENMDKCQSMGKYGRKMLVNKYNTDNMVQNILSAANYVINA